MELIGNAVMPYLFRGAPERSGATPTASTAGEGRVGVVNSGLYPRGDRRSPARAAFDYGLAAVLLIVTLPVLLLAVLIVRLTSRGPAIYRQTRVGRDGRTFTIFKVRSMRHDCERGSGPRWATEHDPRVTAFGRFLRRSHVDELPQLWNVLRGEMGLVGPRPERPEFVAQLEKAIVGYREREQVLPGITGLAQVQLPPDTDVNSVRKKLACDLYYLGHAGFWLDLRILVSTAMKAFGVPSGRSCRLLGIPGGLWPPARGQAADKSGAPCGGPELILSGFGHAEGGPAMA